MILHQMENALNEALKQTDRENFDPLGVHTGDSIVIAPSQTLSDEVRYPEFSLSLAVAESTPGISYASHSGDQDRSPSRRVR